MKISIPAVFAANTLAREGEAGRGWIEALPNMVDSLGQRWGLTLDGTVMHGDNGLVVPVKHADEPCALKVSWLSPATLDEAAVLRAWGGRGAIHLLETDPHSGAMLLERVNHRRSLKNLEIGEGIQVAGKLLRRLSIPAPDGFRHVRRQTQHLSQSLPESWDRLGQPFSRKVLNCVCESIEPLISNANELLVNYDLHWENIYASDREPWLAVDPMVVVGDAEFGLSPLLWWRLEDIQRCGGLERYFPALVEAAELDSKRSRDWALLRSVEYWLWGLEHGLTIDPPRCAFVVDWLDRLH